MISNEEALSMDECYQIQLRVTKDANYYQILGVAEDASEDEIESRYRKLIFECHPDRIKYYPNTRNKLCAEEITKKLNEIHETLIDNDKRRKYDNLLKAQEEASYYSFTPSSSYSKDYNDESQFFNWIAKLLVWVCLYYVLEAVLKLK
jgi:curved DNA-binding protein CbpA